MQAIRTTPDKNGACAVVVSGTTTDMDTNGALRLRANGREFNGGTLGGGYEYRRALPADVDGVVELWTADKFEPRLLDSCTVRNEGEPDIVIEEADEASEKPAKKAAKKK